MPVVVVTDFVFMWQATGKLSVPAKHVADPVVFRFATCFEEGCSVKLTRGEDISAESGAFYSHAICDAAACTLTYHFVWLYT